MNSSTKLAAGLALACTWTTAAHAEDYALDVVTNEDISNARFYTYQAVPSADLFGTPSRANDTLSNDLGTLVANQNYTFNLSTNYGTSTTGDFPFGSTATLNILGTFADGDIATGGFFAGTDSPFNNVAPVAAVNGIVSGDLAVVRNLTAEIRGGGSPFATSTFGLAAYQSMAGPITADLFRFDTSGTRTTIGTITARQVTAVPEPATLAALGFGALAMLRRRRKA